MIQLSIQDFQCTYDNAVGICSEVSRKLDLKFPEAYQQWPLMVKLSRGMRDHEGTAFCELPFCHTMEGEALGGIITYGDGNFGPRAKAYVCSTAEELLALPPMNLETGRIAEVLKACAQLRQEGDEVVLMVSGPFNILNVLIDPIHLFKIMRKAPEDMQRIFDRLQGEILRLMAAAHASGVRLISYSDSSGGVNILGPKLSEAVVDQFTYPLMQQVEKNWGHDMLTLLCPKTALALVGTGRARWEEIRMTNPVAYGEASSQLVGRAAFMGQMCIKNRKFMPENGIIKTLQLL